ncbi:prolycopene isomerase [Natronincola peptidivorans]|uniref:Prolycopene isomerase n=1 Tax=Natronincola peptidivorans TaxID=426128 RepID=A0A1H9Y513_9FIRM|nr:NAD(P)/FAD-dependent oxidoreductase [Natronincola peptidivorans]SES63463.1 prolycopene isomerase [Natronincola peptidivorans]
MSNNFKTEYDAVVVGAGNGGLTAAATLAGKGMKTLLLEQHNLPGGFATSFVRGRFEFEPSLHEISDFGPPDDKGNVRMLLEDRIGLDVEWIEVPEAYRLIVPNEKGGRIDATMPFGEEEFIAKMEEYVPGSKESVVKFIRLCEEVIDAFTYLAESKGNHDKKVLTKEYPNFLKTAPYTLQDVLDSLKMPYRAQKIITAYWCYIGVGVKDMSFTIFGAMFYRYITKQAFIPRFRSHGYTTALDMKIRELGGDIQYNTKVEKIIIEKGQIVGVETSHGDVIKTNYVITNTSPHTVYNQLIYPKTEVPETALKTCNARKVGFSAFVVYLGLDKSAEELGIDEYSYFVYSTPDTNDIYKSFHSLGRPVGQATVCLNKTIPDCSPEGTSILYLTTLFSGDCWRDVEPKDYVKLKNKLAEEMIDEFEKALGINIRDSIEEIEVATPATFANYTGAFNGSVYGYEPVPWDSVLPRMMSMNDEKYIKGLDFSGGFAFRCHGYSSSLQSGETAALLTYRDFMEVKKSE